MFLFTCQKTFDDLMIEIKPSSIQHDDSSTNFKDFTFDDLNLIVVLHGCLLIIIFDSNESLQTEII